MNDLGNGIIITRICFLLLGSFCLHLKYILRDKDWCSSDCVQSKNKQTKQTIKKVVSLGQPSIDFDTAVIGIFFETGSLKVLDG